MDRRVEVGSAVLRGREIVRGVVVALLGDAIGDFFQLERFRGGPEDRLIAVVVREVDQRAVRPRRPVGRARASGRDDSEPDEQGTSHTHCNPQSTIYDLQSYNLQSAATRYGNNGGGTRFFVACSNAYASSISFGSLHAMPVKLTPYGVGFALKPAGNAGVGAFGTNANGTMTVG